MIQGPKVLGPGDKGVQMPFNEAQSRAVRHGKGPMMVLAGPGSGKTTVIVGRVRNLVENQGVSPSNILVITFTRAAARV